ncbi:3-oxoacyl-ACP reductase [Burkholderia sp. Leaf177]|uniref:SDR family NAD(P)-dependent oxidoreductase n=1 Tax=Burkholderia sp. Leaf177 TaxID=1736287 RepID=UPI0006FC4294|nr:SDR family oxidoreductase [Burkholderia sp. Leaf177]KQR78657.1 3-oxoacyl-ACP reductase [Burkholderia sp. Leaf177]
MRLNGKLAVITGGSSGIGFETARLFMDEGARVVLIARNRARLNSALEGLGEGAIGVTADISRPDALKLAIANAQKQLGGIDILFANAGVSETPPIAETSEQAFDDFMNINVKGTIFTVIHALPFLCEGASIILTGSVAARKGRPGDPLYAASKGAIRSFGRTLAMDGDVLARRIRVNVLTPGATVTPLTQEATGNPEVHAYIAEMVPMGRWGDAREIAQAALFLASNASSYMTGSEITVDGGLAHV